jgi:hypothetical protein
MSTVIEYTMVVKPGSYDEVLGLYIDFADSFGLANATEDLILVTGDPEAGVIRGIGVFMDDEQASDVVSASIFERFRDDVAHLLEDTPVREGLELVHVFVKD